MTEQEAINFCKNNPEAAAKIILMVDKLEQRVAELEAQLSMNSTNSSKPPSTLVHLHILKINFLSYQYIPRMVD